MWSDRISVHDYNEWTTMCNTHMGKVHKLQESGWDCKEYFSVRFVNAQLTYMYINESSVRQQYTNIYSNKAAV